MADKKRRLRFSLRALLLLLTFCGVLCGWFYRAKIQPAYRRKAAIAHFRSLNVELNYGVPAQAQGRLSRFLMHYPEQEPRIDAPAWLRRLVAQEWLESPPAGISCVAAKRPLNDADFRRLLELPTIEQINLNCNNVPRGPNHVSMGHHREQRITDAGFETLAQLPCLRRLIVKYANLTEQGMANLAQSQSLEALVISHSDVSDAGLHQLAQLPKLQALSVIGTHVTPKGVAEFAALRPDVDLSVDNEDTSLLAKDASSASVNRRLGKAQFADLDPDEWFMRESTVVNGARVIFWEQRNPADGSQLPHDSSPAPSFAENPTASSAESKTSQPRDWSSRIEAYRRTQIEKNQTAAKDHVDESSVKP